MSQRDRASSPGAHVLTVFRAAARAGKNQSHLAIQRNVTSSVMTFRSMPRKRVSDAVSAIKKRGLGEIHGSVSEMRCETGGGYEGGDCTLRAEHVR
jgi:hypothetical protein